MNTMSLKFQVFYTIFSVHNSDIYRVFTCSSIIEMSTLFIQKKFLFAVLP